MNDEVTIVISNSEAVQFREFQKNHRFFQEYRKFHETFATITKSGVFDIKYGKAILNFSQGELQNVTIEEIKYKK